MDYNTMEGIQFLTINPNPEDQEPRVLSMEVQPLDVHNFAAHWPEWCDQFKVYVATNHDDHLDDKMKLQIFLKCLGREGATMAMSFYPKEKYGVDYDVFDEVYWRMSELWNVAKDVDQDRRRTRDISEERRRFMENSADEIDNDKWLLLIPHLSLCELEYMAEAVPRLERIVRNHSRLFGVKIEKCCLEKYSVDTDKEVFQKYESVSSVTLKDISESDARGVLQVCKNIKRLGMHNMAIYEDISGFPGQLSELTLTDCGIEKKLMDKWISSSQSTLRRLCLDNFKLTFKILVTDQYYSFGPFQYPFDNLHSLSMKRDVSDVEFRFWSDLQFLSLSNKKLGQFFCRDLTHVYVDAISKEDLEDLLGRQISKLSFFSLPYIRAFTSLEYLWIMCPVNPKYKEAIEQLEIKTVVVHYQHEPEPPEGELNLIFDMLNEYCLLEITDYLSVPDWMRFGQLHWKIEMALVSYKYTRVQLTDEHIKLSGIPTESYHFNYISQFVTRVGYFYDKSFIYKFPSLKSFSIGGYTSFKEVEAFPKAIEKLECNCRVYGLQSNFRNINSTLRVLKLIDSPGQECLKELTNLLDIEISSFIPIDDVMLVLKQNPQLRRIHIDFGDDWQNYEQIFKLIGTMERLKDLGIIGSLSSDEISQDCKIILKDLLETVGPRLTKLTISCTTMIALAGSLTNTKIQELRVSRVLMENDIIRILPILCSVKSVTKLWVYNGHQLPFYNIFKASELLLLIKSLPCLVVLELDSRYYEIRFEVELREYLKTSNRQLRINKTTYP